MTQDQPNYDTMVEALQGLKVRGFKRDFNLKETCIECQLTGDSFQPEQFKIVEWHRFEGMSDPNDNSVVYGIVTTDGSKGVLVDAYGAYTQALSPGMIQAFRIEY
jgi:hypothetical protein